MKDNISSILKIGKRRHIKCNMKANHIASYTFIKYGISLPGLVCSVLLPVYQKRKYRHNS